MIRFHRWLTLILAMTLSTVVAPIRSAHAASRSDASAAIPDAGNPGPTDLPKGA